MEESTYFRVGPVDLTKMSFTSADRKSTRLNFSHEWISYAVFCLKKKTAGCRDDTGDRRAHRRLSCARGVFDAPIALSDDARSRILRDRACVSAGRARKRPPRPPH